MIQTPEKCSIRQHIYLASGLTETAFIAKRRIIKFPLYVSTSSDVFQSGASNISLNLNVLNIILKKIAAVTAFSLLFLVSPLVCARSAELRVTEVAESGSTLNISIDGAFEIRGVSAKPETKELVFPSYVSKGKVYRQFSAVSRDYKKYLFDAVSKKELSKAGGNVGFKINKFKTARSHKTVAAFASVIFEDRLEVECRIMKGKDGLWISWPSAKKDGVWEKQFVFLDGGLKYSVENALMEKYEKKSEDERKKTR